MSRLVITVMLALCCFATARAGSTVALRNGAVWPQSNALMLGDVAQVGPAGSDCSARLSAMPVAQRLGPGAPIIITRLDIAAALSRHPELGDCEVQWQGAAFGRTWTKGSPVDLEALRNAGAEQLRIVLARRYRDVEVHALGSDLAAWETSSDASFEFGGLDAAPKKRMALEVRVIEAGQVQRRIPLWYTVSALADVWQLDSDVPAGRLLADATMHIGTTDVAALRAPPVTAEALPLAMTRLAFRTALKADCVLTQADLVNAPDVTAGEAVTLRYQSASVTLETAARALQSGFVGDRVQVLNPRSDETFDARVAGVSTVEVVQ